MKLKRKFFANPQDMQNQQPQIGNIPGKDLQIEQMRMQRQMMMNARLRQRMQSEEKMAQAKRIASIQKLEQRKNEQESRDRINSSKMNVRRKEMEKDNTHLYKSRPTMTPPVPMK